MVPRIIYFLFYARAITRKLFMRANVYATKTPKKKLLQTHNLGTYFLEHSVNTDPHKDTLLSFMNASTYPTCIKKNICT